MKVVFFTVLAFSCALANVALRRSSARLEGRIMGGKDTIIYLHPYQVLLEYTDYRVCGGSIVSRTVIVTAAHCVEDVENMRDFKVRVGTSLRAKGGILMPVKTILSHEKYDPKAFDTDYDIALIMLEEPLRYSLAVRPLALPEQDDTVPGGTVAVSTGWGTIGPDEPVSSILQVVRLSVLSEEDCIKAYPERPVTPRMICAGVEESGKGICKGDSGGPLVALGKLQGITSWRIECDGGQRPSVYTRVSALRDWIREHSGV